MTMNIPNALSLFRLLLVPVFVLVFLSGHAYAYYIAIGVLLLAALTDVLDGKIARKYNQITALGRILDPLADKLMVLAALFCLAKVGRIPWIICMLYSAKELLQIVGGLFIYKRTKDMPAANKLGKSATVCLYGAIVLTTLFDIPQNILYLMFGAVFLLVFAAFFSNTKSGVQMVKENKL